MPRQRYNKNQLYEFCQHFWSFLEERQMISEPTTKEKLRDLYQREFKPNSPFKLPCFSMIIFNLKRFRFVNIKDREYVYFSRSPRNKSSSASKTSNSSQSSGAKTTLTPQKKLSQQVLLYVDQHLALKDVSSSTRKKATSGTLRNPYYCNICDIYVNSTSQLDIHKERGPHKLNCLKHLMDLKKSDLITCKENIVIDAVGTLTNENDGQIKVNLKAGEVKHIMISIQNKGKTKVNLDGCQALQYVSSCKLDDPIGVTIKKTSVPIKPDENYEILVKYSSSDPGEEEIPIVFQFSKDGKQFRILRYLMLNVTNEISTELKAVFPYKPPPRAALSVMGDNIVQGLPLDKDACEDDLKRLIPLKKYNIPSSLRSLVNHGLKPFQGITESQKAELDRILKLLDSEITAETQKQRFQLLLYLEEIQMEVDIRGYDMHKVTMKNVKENPALLSLEVPGLAENRPSVLKADRLYVQHNNSQKINGKEYEGFVHNVRELEVWLGFSSRFREEFIDKQLFSVRFTFTRYPLRLQHQAVVLCDELSLTSFLFPKGQMLIDEKKNTLPEIRLFNRILNDNEEQLQAIKTIVSGCYGSTPYIIFGPPGTGKTVTLVEAMKQVAVHYKNSHILACAPSNSAADLITQRLLMHISPSDIFRMNAMSRDWQTIPENIKKVCNYNENTTKYFYPAKEKLMKFKFVITTLVTAGRLVAANFPTLHFTHVFVDEAGHATEPESLIPVAGILESLSHERSGHLILAGDPKQLGPILRSPFAIKYGLDRSFMERLMLNCDIYQRSENGYNANFITKLLRNYRSHPVLITNPNELFYENELKACADELVRNRLCSWEGLPHKNFPHIFHGVVGKDERESHSPSFFNISEINTVVEYIKELLSCRSVNVKPSEIGIISPYRQQVHKIRKALQNLGKQKDKLKEMQNKDPVGITVGSTEEFQGQERLIIIISTVRSTPHLLQLDKKFHLGFLCNPKRFNVAITRAKALLIVIGNPHVLRRDPCWNKLMEYCHQNGSTKGVPPLCNRDIDQMVDRLEMLNLGEDVPLSFQDSLMFVQDNLMLCSPLFNIEQRWRNDL